MGQLILDDESILEISNLYHAWFLKKARMNNKRMHGQPRSNMPLNFFEVGDNNESFLSLLYLFPGFQMIMLIIPNKKKKRNKNCQKTMELAFKMGN